MSDNPTNTEQNQIKCKNCGAMLAFEPGTQTLKCEYCQTENEIQLSNEKIEEIDFEKFISTQLDTTPKVELTVVKCNSCGATTTLAEGVIADNCDFCATPLVLDQAETAQVIEPKSLIPFTIKAKEGTVLYQTWLKKLWWAPNDLKKLARQKGKLGGVYIPFWTFDAETYTQYTGERGDDYEETETFTNSDGDEETQSVTKTSWSSVRGSVSRFFDDVLVLASNSLPVNYVDRLEPWNFNELVPYDKNFITGFKAETYQIGVKDGLQSAKLKMDETIVSDIHSDIGGDHQRIHSKDTTYSEVMFKHMLLPIWISAYRYNNKLYRFMINGQTGEVQGERPYSWIKITLAVLLVILIIAAIYYYSKYYA